MLSLHQQHSALLHIAIVWTGKLAATAPWLYLGLEVELGVEPTTFPGHDPGLVLDTSTRVPDWFGYPGSSEDMRYLREQNMALAQRSPFQAIQDASIILFFMDDHFEALLVEGQILSTQLGVNDSIFNETLRRVVRYSI